MLVLDLCVPPDEVDRARALGALWNTERQLWQVPAGSDPMPFAAWLVAGLECNIRAPGYFVATTPFCCWRCRGITHVHGFALPAGYEALNTDDESGEDFWEEADDSPTFVYHIDCLSLEPMERMRSVTDTYRLCYDRGLDAYHWLNVCHYCGLQLNDTAVFSELGYGFMPLTPEQAKHITLCYVDAPFTASAGGWWLGSQLFDSMTFALPHRSISKV
jgi:hypothetical protein